MKDYIDREAFVARYRKQFCEDCDRRKGIKNGKLKFCYEIGDAPCRACDIDDMLDYVEDFPAADVVEVRHGNWILHDESTLDRKPKRGEAIFCDQCGEMALGYSFWECDLKPSNFCPNCGAKMDGGVNDA